MVNELKELHTEAKILREAKWDNLKLLRQEKITEERYEEKRDTIQKLMELNDKKQKALWKESMKNLNKSARIIDAMCYLTILMTGIVIGITLMKVL